MKTLEELRKEIDEIDQELLHMLAKRLGVVREIGALKNAHGLPIVDEKRREELLEKIKQKAKDSHLSEKFVEDLFKTIHDHAVELQKR